MNKAPIFAALATTVLLAGCVSTGPTTVAQAPVQTAALPQEVEPTTPTPAAATAAAMSSTDVLAFIEPAAVGRMGDRARSEAASAQFYALQFGRPGAPRAWQGGDGTTGSVTVGPYVRVNALDCREFTHRVTVGGDSYARTGTACREADGSWDVVDARTA